MTEDQKLYEDLIRRIAELERQVANLNTVVYALVGKVVKQETTK